MLAGAVSSLGLVSPRVATDGVTPIFPGKKLMTFFAHNCRHFYWFHSGVIPLEGVTSHHFYLFDLVCPLFFVNSEQIFFLRVSPPWRVSPRAVPPPLVMPLSWRSPGHDTSPSSGSPMHYLDTPDFLTLVCPLQTLTIWRRSMLMASSRNGRKTKD